MLPNRGHVNVAVRELPRAVARTRLNDYGLELEALIDACGLTWDE